MIWAIGLLAIGILLSAFFSGSETGFYRVARVRLVLDALDGDLIARGLLWLTNNPSLFIATTLIGNNLANYITSLAIVLITTHVYGESTYVAAILAPVMFSPLIFVYGELLPKNLYFYAPNKLLRRGGPFFLLFTVLFLLVSTVLWVLGRCLQWLVGEAPENIRLALARNELQQVFQKGQEVGILLPSQRRLAQSLFAMAGQPVMNFCTPVGRLPSIRLGTKRVEVLRLARRQRVPALPVRQADGRQLVGYVRMVDLYLNPSDRIEKVRPLMEIPQSGTHSGALLQMQSRREPMARVVDDSGQTVGLVYLGDLSDPLFQGTE